jgi:hypothetical protein
MTAGLVEVRALPESSTATHSELEGHEIADSWWPGSMLLTVQLAPAPAAGSVEVATLLESSTATHSALDAQEMPVRALLPSALLSVQLALAPSAGSVEVRTLPWLSPPRTANSTSRRRRAGRCRGRCS